ncbi:hypothetical protein V6N13_041427 [Hibiscus sabdariffa]
MVSGYMRAKPCIGPCLYPAYKSGSTNKYQRLRRKLRPDPRRWARRVVVAFVTDIADVAIAATVLATAVIALRRDE